MVNRVRCTLMIFLALMFAKQPLLATSFIDRLGLEVGGIGGGTSPKEYNEVFERLGLGHIDRLFGVGAGLSADVSSNIRLALRTGYLWGSTDRGEIFVGGGPLGTPTAFEYRVGSIPFTIGVDLRLTNKSAALALRVSGGVQFVSVTEKIDAQPAEGFSGIELTERAIFPSATVAVAAEWLVSKGVYFGAGGGYRASKGEVPFPGSSNFSPDFDLSGGFGTAYVIVQPWNLSP